MESSKYPENSPSPTLHMHRHAHTMTLLTSAVLESDEGRDGRCLDNGDRVYFPSSLPGSQEVNK